jgi:transcription elongation factor GreA
MVTGDSMQNLNLGDAASQYLNTLSGEKRGLSQPGIHKFIKWYDRDKPILGIRGAEAGGFAERISLTDSDAAKKLEHVRAFFNYAHKQGWTKDNLSVSLRVKKPKTRSKTPVRKLVREPIPLNQETHDGLVAEVAALKTRRTEVMRDVQHAAADKDLRENVPYHAAREKKGMIEGKILEIEETLARAVITEEKQEKGHLICVGDTIILQVPDSIEEMKFKLCNPKEVASGKGKISVASPVGKAALGKKPGDTITVAVPAGKVQYFIVRIER